MRICSKEIVTSPCTLPEVELPSPIPKNYYYQKRGVPGVMNGTVSYVVEIRGQVVFLLSFFSRR